MSTTFSLITLAYNSKPHLRRCLEALSVLDADIICTDNGSTDGTDFKALQTEFLHVKFALFGENLGFAAGNNRAANLATGDWLGFINPDAFADANWIEAMRTAINTHPETAIFTSLQVDASDPSRMDGAGDGMSFFGFPFRMGYGRPVPVDLKTARVFAPCGAAFLIRRELWEALGGFDERFFAYCEDADLGFRAQLLGQGCVFVPDARVAHVGSASTGKRSDFALYHGYRNRIWLYAKNMPPALLIATLPVHAALTLIGALKDTLAGRGGVVWRAMADALNGMGPILRERAAIGKTRKISALRLAALLTWNPLIIARRALDHRRLG
ncbi:MAG: glycosyltransferase family 2 protein [Asticcacaulis sp.]